MNPRLLTGRLVAAAAAAAATVVLVAGCADFSEQDRSRAAGSFTSEPERQAGPPDDPGQQSPETDEPPTGPCVDPDPAVIATCLGTTGGVRPASMDGMTTYVAERTTGKIIISKRYGPQRVIATVPVDAGGDGGLIDFELSPSYQQDRLIYALITTGSDNRVVRIAPGDSVKPILTGIPKGATGNMGSISFASPTELRVATGNAGDAGAANDPGSLAGKLLTLDPNVPGVRPQIVASGLGSNVSLCPDPTGGKLYLADSGPAGDRLLQVEAGGLKRLWSWGDRPGLTGCAVYGGVISVSMATKFRIESLTAPTDANPAISEPTATELKEGLGAVGRMTTFGAGAQVATINKTVPGAAETTTNDRVSLFFGGGGTTEDRT